MKHEKYPGHSGYMTITMPVEDWIWWCKFLSQLLKDEHQDEWTADDLEVIERSMQGAEEADHVAARHD